MKKNILKKKVSYHDKTKKTTLKILINKKDNFDADNGDMVYILTADQYHQLHQQKESNNQTMIKDLETNLKEIIVDSNKKTLNRIHEIEKKHQKQIETLNQQHKEEIEKIIQIMQSYQIPVPATSETSDHQQKKTPIIKQLEKINANKNY